MSTAYQGSLFDYLYPPFRITKPLRVIELFAGYGSQMMAFERLSKDGLIPLGVESYKICEWAIPSFVAWAKIHASDDKQDYSEGKSKEDLARILCEKGASLDWKTPASLALLKRKPEKYLRDAFNAMIASNNVVDITRAKGSDFAMVERERYQVVMTWSFPCQSLSLAGKRAGMDEGSGSESSLGYEVLRILDEMKIINQLPTILVMENVPQFASKTNRTNIIKIQDRLGKLGYKSYIDVQSATDFGVPQTRKRCFMISILGDYSYQFPIPFPLKKKLKDVLEQNVPEKYYLSDKMVKYVLASGTKNYHPKPGIDPEIGRTVNTSPASHRSGVDNYITDLKRSDVSKLVPRKDGCSNTLTTVTKDNLIAEKKPICLNPKGGRGGVEGLQPSVENRVYSSEGTATAATTSFLPNYMDLTLRIRKLTSRECFRLQDVLDSDYDKIKDLFPESILYHLAGDSICVANLYYDCKMLCLGGENDEERK